jgi:hypothetical protein
MRREGAKRERKRERERLVAVKMATLDADVLDDSYE